MAPVDRAMGPPAPDPVLCACPGCDRDALADGAYCPGCEEEPHAGHCPRCRRILFALEPPVCPGCGAAIELRTRAPAPGTDR